MSLFNPSGKGIKLLIEPPKKKTKKQKAVGLRIPKLNKKLTEEKKQLKKLKKKKKKKKIKKKKCYMARL